MTAQTAMNKPTKRRDARILRLQKAITCVEQSIRCTSATMRSALATDEWTGYKSFAESCFGPVLAISDKTQFARYKQCLRRGDAIYARAMKLSPVGLQAMRRDVLSRAADREYGTAWEILEQLLAGNHYVQALLDRPFESCAAEREDIARPIGSASEFAKRDDGSRQLALLRGQHSTLCASHSRLRQHDAEASADSTTGDQALHWDALFGFTDQADRPGMSSIDDSLFSNSDATLPSGTPQMM